MGEASGSTTIGSVRNVSRNCSMAAGETNKHNKQIRKTIPPTIKNMIFENRSSNHFQNAWCTTSQKMNPQNASRNCSMTAGESTTHNKQTRKTIQPTINKRIFENRLSNHFRKDWRANPQKMDPLGGRITLVKGVSKSIMSQQHGGEGSFQSVHCKTAKPQPSSGGAASRILGVYPGKRRIM